MPLSNHADHKPPQFEHRQPHRQSYHNPHTSMGAAGHWIKTAGILAPLVIGEFVADSEKRWRYIRIASVATALVSEGFWTHKVHRERQEARQREQECLERA